MRKSLLIITLGLIVFTTLHLWATSDRTDQEKQVSQSTDTGTAQVGGDFTLTDQNGKVVSAMDFRGRIMLVFFGFTHCPDICPVTVATLSKTMGLLGDKADMVAPLFITVDPDRDTPQAMKEYLANFDRHIVGLTGTQEQIRQVASAYKTYYARTAPAATTAHQHDEHQEGHDANYSIDHSGFIYMMGKDGKYVRVFPFDVNAEELAHALQAALG